MSTRSFVLLDRDGTIIVERHYLSDPDQVELIDGVTAALRRLTAKGLGLAVVTNQSGIGRGFFDRKRLERIHQRMDDLLNADGICLDGIYYCPHRPEDGCDCRKPRTGMIDRAKKQLRFDPHESFLIGDKPCDINLGRAVGATTFLVGTGYAAEMQQGPDVMADYRVKDLAEAAGIIENLITRAGRA